MPRVREFCPNAALEKAMHVFWAKGFVGTSVEDLVEATGVSRYGLYNEFGDKNGLFLAALEHYRCSVVKPILDLIQAPDAGLDSLRDLFRMMAAFARQPGGKLGCLIFNSVSEMGHHDAMTASKILELREHLKLGIRRMLECAALHGELPARVEVGREADFLFGILHALPTLARSGADADLIENVVAVALATLD